MNRPLPVVLQIKAWKHANAVFHLDMIPSKVLYFFFLTSCPQICCAEKAPRDDDSEDPFVIAQGSPGNQWTFQTSPGDGPLLARTIASYVNRIVDEREEARQAERELAKEQKHQEVALKAQKAYVARVRAARAGDKDTEGISRKPQSYPEISCSPSILSPGGDSFLSPTTA